MNILITGGGGFIGSHLTEKLLKKGNKVTIIDNFCSSRKENIQSFKDNENFELIEQDVLNPLKIEKDLDYVLHLASRASPVDYQEYPIHTLRTNSEGTLKMLKLAKEKNAKFLYSSTSEVYGDPKVHPQPESYWGHVNPNGPRACYDEAKRFGEATIASFAKKDGLDYRIIRIFNTYGPRMREDDGRVISNFITQALKNKPITVYGDGTQTRSFCYVSDLVNGIIEAMNSQSGEVFNLGNPDEYTIKELAEMIQQLTNTNSEIVHKQLPKDNPERRKPNISKAKRILNWEPKLNLNSGLDKTINYFEKLE